jgi:hypothetical protein
MKKLYLLDYQRPNTRIVDIRPMRNMLLVSPLESHQESFENDSDFDSLWEE